MTILCTIDLETREVSIPSGQCIAAYDHNVDVIRFQAETIPGFSLNTSSIRIAAQGPNKSRHDYAVDPATVAIEEETGYITFDWPIPAGVTEMPIGSGFKYGDKGQLIFAVCAEIISGSALSKAWHSDDGIITVVAHLEPEAGGGEDPEEEATNRQMIGQLRTDVTAMQAEIDGKADKTFVTPEDFGAKGDGVTDDTQAIQNAIDSGYPVIFDATKTYKTGRISVEHDAIIDFNNCILHGTGTRIIDCSGSTIGSTVLTGAYSKGTNVFTVSDATGINAGDLLLIYDENSIYYQAGGIDFYNSGLVKVENVTGTQVTVNAPIEFDLTVNSIVQIYRPIRVNISNIGGLTFDDIAASESAIYLTACIDSVISGVKDVSHDLKNVIVLQKCFHTLIENSMIRSNYVNPSEDNSYYYIVGISGGSCDTVVSNCDFMSKWHSLATNGAYAVSRTTVRDCLLNSVGNNNIFSYLDHGCGINTHIENTKVSGVRFANSFSIVNSVIVDRGNGSATLSYKGSPNSDLTNGLIENVRFLGTGASITTSSTDSTADCNLNLIAKNCKTIGAPRVSLVPERTDFGLLVLDNTVASLSNVRDGSVKKLIIKDAIYNDSIVLYDGIYDSVILSNLTMNLENVSFTMPVPNLQMSNVVIQSSSKRPSIRITADNAQITNLKLGKHNNYTGKLEINTGCVVCISNSEFALGTYTSGVILNAKNCVINADAKYGDIVCGTDGVLYRVYFDANGQQISAI